MKQRGGCWVKEGKEGSGKEGRLLYKVHGWSALSPVAPDLLWNFFFFFFFFCSSAASRNGRRTHNVIELLVDWTFYSHLRACRE